MLKLRNSEKAFTTLGVLLVLAIVAIIGSTGYFVYHANKKTTNTYGVSTHPAAQTNGGKGGQGGPDTGPAKTEVFLIPEWHVKAQLTPVPKELIQYKINEANGEQQALFTSQAILDADKTCTAESGVGGMIVQASPTQHFFFDVDTGKTVQQAVDDGDITGARKAGQYYYWYQHPQSACGTIQQSLQDQLIVDVQSIVSNLTTE